MKNLRNLMQGQNQDATPVINDDAQGTNAPSRAPVVVDDKRQMEQLAPYIRPDETLRAVLDMKGGGTGFLGITDKRIIIYDNAFLGKRKALITVPFSRITRVASEDESGGVFSANWRVSSKLMVWVGSEAYDFDFVGADKAHRAYELIVDGIL